MSLAKFEYSDEENKKRPKMNILINPSLIKPIPNVFIPTICAHKLVFFLPLNLRSMDEVTYKGVVDCASKEALRPSSKTLTPVIFDD